MHDALNHDHRISSASEFFALMHLLKQTEAVLQLDGNCTLDEFDNGTFPCDIINMLFWNRHTQQHYFIAADGYHGGGSFEIVKDGADLASIKASIHALGSVFEEK